MSTIHVVKRFRGEGATFVRCMFRINLARPNFHSENNRRKINQEPWFLVQICRFVCWMFPINLAKPAYFMNQFFTSQEPDLSADVLNYLGHTSLNSEQSKKISQEPDLSAAYYGSTWPNQTSILKTNGQNIAEIQICPLHVTDQLGPTKLPFLKQREKMMKQRPTFVC